MKDKLSLREFQARLAERLQSAARRDQSASKLGFLAGGRHWLVDLGQVNEVVAAGEVTPVPWAQPWFIGVVSVRGVLYGCTDLAAFVGMAAPMVGEEVNILLAHPRFGINAAFRIERALGLRDVSAMRSKPSDQHGQDWSVMEWHDQDDTVWIELSVERLMANPAFLRAGI